MWDAAGQERVVLRRFAWNHLAQFGAAVTASSRFFSPPWDVLATIQKKRGQLDAAERAGVAAPRTAHPRSAAEARAAAELIGFPVLVKPSSTEGFKRRFGKQAFRCESAVEVERAYDEAEPYEPMLQEFIPGGDDFLWTLGAALAADGEVLATF